MIRDADPHGNAPRATIMWGSSPRARRLLVVVTLLLGAASAGIEGVAHAEPSKDDCIDANTTAQTLRLQNKLRRAREWLVLCGSASCPSIVREDCIARMGELDAVLPTLVFEATDAEGHDLSAVKVTMDGALLLEKLDGSSVAVDPGEHELTFETSGEPAVQRRVIVREGDKLRKEAVSFGAPKRTSAAEKRATLSIIAGTGDDVLIDGERLGTGRWSGQVAPGSHEIRVTHAGKRPYRASVDLPADGRRDIDVTLEEEKRGGVPIWLWVAAGVVAAGGLAVGSYFVFRPEEHQTGTRPIGGMDSVTLSFGLWNRNR